MKSVLRGTAWGTVWISCMLLLILVPDLAFAETTALNFTPQPSDLSMTYLGNIFGVVDGVLYGGGSQILGEMFAVINSAVLTMGGATLIYIVIVGTLNTSADGQFLGKNWDSLWTPLRSVIGFGGLFIYPSGYSTTQVCIMWVVTQGIGAANLTWNAALNYLQMGGTIVQVSTPTTASNTADNYSIITGTSTTLAGLTCMTALQTQLETLRAKYLALASSNENPSGPCYDTCDKDCTDEQQDMKDFCDNPVPSFIDSGDITEAQNTAVEKCTEQGGGSNNAKCSNAYLPLPFFDTTDPYSGLNGICGTLQWALMDNDGSDDIEAASEELNLSADEEAEMNNARATAVQQVYSDMTMVANDIVGNDLTLSDLQSTCLESTGNCYFNTTAYSASAPLGVPTDMSGELSTTSCSRSSTASNACWSWISPDSSFSATQSGIELQSAVSSYNTIIEPTLNALANSTEIADASSFIEQAQASGWMTAGTYFFDLINLNEISATTVLFDNDSNFNKSTYPPNLNSNFCTNGSGVSGASNVLCTWYSGINDSYIDTYTNEIVHLMQGPITGSNIVPVPAYPTSSSAVSPWPAINTTTLATTAYGYISNAANVVIESQTTTLTADSISVGTLDLPDYPSPSIEEVDCGSGGKFDTRIGKWVCKKAVNGFIGVMNKVLEQAVEAVELAFEILIYYPLAAIAAAFQEATEYMNTTTNPILGLAKVGDLFINVASSIWLAMGVGTAFISLAPFAGSSILVMVTITFPLIFAWLGVLWTLGIMGAYVIPMTPYAVFTMGVFGWFIGVLETMVAAPIMAFGIIIPEGHPVFGKSTESLMMVLSIFIRPLLMIMGLFAAIILSTEGIRLINYGFSYYLSTMWDTLKFTSGGFTQLFAAFFYFSFYITLCNAIVTKSCSLIYSFADGITQYIGGGIQQSFGSGTAAEVGSQIQSQGKEGGQSTQQGISQRRSEFQKKNAEKGGSAGGSSGGGGSNDLHVG